MSNKLPIHTIACTLGMETAEVRSKLVEYVSHRPELSIRTIASMLEIPYSTLTKVLRDAGYRRREYKRLADFDLERLEVK
jgi:hypothetical protein